MKSILTTDGREVELLPVAQASIEQVRLAVLREFEKRGAQLAIPTYFVRTGGGDPQEFPHREETIKEAPQDDVAKWEAYHKTQVELERATNERATKFMLYRGVKVDEIAMQKALQEQAFFGILAPESPIDKALHYIQTEILKTPADILAAVQGIMMLSMSGVSEDTMRAVEESFRRALEKTGRGAAAGTENAEGKVV